MRFTVVTILPELIEPALAAGVVGRAREAGTIAAIEGGMQDLLVIHDGEIERLLPLVDEFVTDIDLDNGVVTVDPPEGLPVSKRR